MISYSKKFILIHIPKTAGTSLIFTLRPYFPWQHRLKYVRRLMQLFNQNIGGIQADHIAANHIRLKAPDLFAQYFKFAFIRNPWDLLVSWHFYLLGYPGHPEHDTVKALGSFENHVRWMMDNRLFTQSQYVVDEQGKIIVDFIGRFERVEEDYRILCRRLGMHEQPLPHRNRSSRGDYRLYYSDSLASLVQERLREDIERFGYSFE